jgi:nicotinamide-nucleotide amidase
MFNKQYIQNVAELLFRSRQTISVAESVTSGFLQAALSSGENASIFFQGGLTAYNINQKYTHFHIDLANAVQTNCVSEQTAKEMALGVAQTFSSDWGLATTGYAAPIPGHHNNELFAWYAIVFQEMHVASGTIIVEVKDPVEIQLEYTDRVLMELLKQLELRK